jgi:hypothetical protein
MGVSLRAYARHRGCALFAVQKARKRGHIPVLADGSVDIEAADAAWDAAAAARRIAEKVPGGPDAGNAPPGTVAAAEATVRGVLSEHGAPAGKVLTLSDAKLAGELLRVQQRANAIAAQAVESRLRQRAMADDAIPKRFVDALIANVANVIAQYVDPRDVPAAFDRLRELQEAVVPGTREARGPDGRRYG